MEDKLPSLSGIASAFEDPCLGKYLAGLWEKDFFRGLAWISKEVSRSEKYVAPTWSWISCQCTNTPIKWRPASFESEYAPNHPLYKAVPVEYKLWKDRYGPVLLNSDMKLETSDPRGKLLAGSSVTIKAFCHNFYFDNAKVEKGHTGSYILRINPDVAMHGTWHFKKPNTASSVKIFVGAQIAMDKQSSNGKHDPLTVYILVLEATNEMQLTFKRVGVLRALPSQIGLDFGFPAIQRSGEREVHDDSNDVWKSRILKLI